MPHYPSGRPPQRTTKNDRPPRARPREYVQALNTVLSRSPNGVTPAELIDQATGKPNGQRILEAIAVLAVGTEQEIEAFFGAPMRMRPRDRRHALALLEKRRFGQVPTVSETPLDPGHVQIVNVFTTSPEYAFVTDAPPRRLSAGSTVNHD